MRQQLGFGSIFYESMRSGSLIVAHQALQRRGKDVAVIVSVEDYELLKAIEDKADLEMIRKIKEEGGDDVLWDDLKKELKL
jgi:hypothetical protein